MDLFNQNNSFSAYIETIKGVNKITDIIAQTGTACRKILFEENL